MEKNLKRVAALVLSAAFLLSGCSASRAAQNAATADIDLPVLGPQEPQVPQERTVYPIASEYTEYADIQVTVSAVMPAVEGAGPTDIPEKTEEGPLTVPPNTGALGGVFEHKESSEAEDTSKVEETAETEPVPEQTELVDQQLTSETNATDGSGTALDPPEAAQPPEQEETKDFRVFRGPSGNADGIYQLRAIEELDGVEEIFTGCMGKAVAWNNGDNQFLPSFEDLDNAQWLSCAQTGEYARNIEMTHCYVSGRSVYYANSAKTMFQVQVYDNACNLIEVIVMSASSAQQDSWTTDITPTLSAIQGEAASDFPAPTGEDGQRIQELEAQVKQITIIAIAVGAVLLLVAAFLSVLVVRNRRRRRRRRKPVMSEGNGEPLSVKAVGTLWNIGRRSGQQDSYGVVDCVAGKLAVVADGMGGLSDGDKVSQKIVATIRSDASRLKGEGKGLLYQLVAHANQEVNRMLGPALQYKCGSTLMMTLIKGNQMYWVAVGDSRIYLYRGGRLIQMNREHIYQYDLLQRFVNGNLGFAEAMRDAQISRVSSFIGMGELKHVDGGLEPVELMKGDRVLLMSDGVFNALSDVEIADIIRQAPSAAEAASQMEQCVLQKNLKNQDNFTCVIQEM